MLVCWVGAIASLLLVANVWPRATLAVSFVCFLSFISAAQDFSSYQSDGMLLEAGFIGLFFAPPGFWPGLARANAPSRASLFLLRWEWFRIYFESGVAKMASGDLSWRNFTAMDDYYQNGPLPTWIGWYVQHFPHWFQASAVFLTLAIELVLVWMLFLPRRFRIACFCIVTPFEIGIILTANYAFLNYLVLALGFLLLDDRVIEWILPIRLRALVDRKPAPAAIVESPPVGSRAHWRDSAQACPLEHCRDLPRAGFLRDLGVAHMAACAGRPAAAKARAAARAIPHRESLRLVRGDDSRALRNRIPGINRRHQLDAVPVPL